MKKLLTLLVLIATMATFAQAPQGFNYQATVRNSAGALITNQIVGFKFSIKQTSASGTTVYSETQYVTPDNLGQVSLVVGTGTPSTGTFATINWSSGTYYLAIELNTGTGFLAMGTTQLLSVPYALYANSSGSSQSQGKTSIYLTGNITNAQAAAKIANELGPNTDNIYVLNTTGLTTIDLSAFVTAATIKISGNAVLTNVNLNGLTTVYDYFEVTNNPSLSSISLLALTYCSQLNLRYNSLSTSTVNSILNRFLTVLPLSGKSIVLSGQTPPAPPTAQGIIDKQTLNDAGNYIEVDCSITVSTTAITSITSTSASSGGNVNYDNNECYVNQIGVCWSTSPNPTTALTTRTYDYGGQFSSYINGLTPGTTYYVRAYAESNGSTAYGNEVSFTTTLPSVVEEITNDDVQVSKSFAYGNYILNGYVIIPDGVTISFEAGTTITADASVGGNDAIVVLKGGKLIMEGTAAEPIICTEKSNTPGSWGGIIMYGDAPIVGSNGVTTATSEDGLYLIYGGTNPTHSSGSLKYVQVLYAGQVITTNSKENNGFSFYSVGSGTVLENLVAYKGKDDGFEFYGGTVSAKNLISYGNYDDSFDWQDGWRGELNTNWYAYQVGTANYGIEIEAKSVNNSFWPKIAGITLKRALGTLTESLSEIQIDAFQFKKQGNGDFSNIVIDGYKNYTNPNTSAVALSGAVQVLDLVTYNNQIAGGKVKLTNIKITNSDNVFTNGANTFTTTTNSFNPLSNWLPTTTATGASLTAGNWSKVDGVNLLSNL